MSVSANPYLLVLPQLMSAKKKIGQVAAFYDPAKVSLAGFDSVCLDATQFREQLRRNLCITVSDEELGALVYLFDKNGDGFIDTVEFKNEFFRLGKQERAKHFQREQEEKARHEKRMKAIENRQKAYLARFSETKISDKWTDLQQKNAIKKVANIAFTYDGFKGGLESFADAKAIRPEEFREILRRKFETYLTPEETGALVDIFDRDQNGMVDTREFLYQFFRIGRSERERHFRRQKELTLKNQNEEENRRLEAKAKYCKLVEAEIKPHTKEDYDSALRKITQAALYFKGDSVFSSNIWKSFESSDLNPTEFKELLKTNFDIYLTPGELDAMIVVFDTDKSGDISCVEFITTFFRIALKERSKILQAKKEKERKHAIAEKERKEARIRRQKMMTLTSVVWPDLPHESDDTNELSFNEPFITVQELAASIGVGPGEVGKYLLDNHQMVCDSRASIDSKIAKEIALHHGCKIKDGAKSEVSNKPKRSVAPPLPTDKKGSRNEFLQNKPTLQSAINRKAMSSKSAHASMADAYPSASMDCKDFIRNLERQEREVRKKKLKAKKGSKGGKKKQKDGIDAFKTTNSNQLNQPVLDDWQFADEGEQKAAMNSSLYSTDEFESRPGTSAHSNRGGSGDAARKGNQRSFAGLDGTSSPSPSIEEEN